MVDAPSCPSCESLMVHSGPAYKCPNCGEQVHQLLPHTVSVSQEMWNEMLALLRSSWEQIDFSYEGLTAQEQAAISKDVHGLLVALMREKGWVS